MRIATRSALAGLACAVLALGLALPALTQTQDAATEAWVLPRTPDGHPDLQGNWTNATMTRIERPPGYERVMAPEQVAALEGDRATFIDTHLADSDPDREAPAVGGVPWGDSLENEASALYDKISALYDPPFGGAGAYNIFYLDPGDRVAIWNGEPRSSLVVDPPDGRIPPLSPEGEKARSELAQQRAQFGELRQSGESLACLALLTFVRLQRRPADDPQLLLQQQLHHRSDRRSRDGHDRNGARRSHHQVGRAYAAASAHPSVVGRLVGPLGRRYAGGGDDKSAAPAAQRKH